MAQWPSTAGGGTGQPPPPKQAPHCTAPGQQLGDNPRGRHCRRRGGMNTGMVIIGGGHHNVTQAEMRGRSRQGSGRSTCHSLPLPTVNITWKRGDSGRPGGMTNTLGIRSTAPGTQPEGCRAPLCKTMTKRPWVLIPIHRVTTWYHLLTYTP